MKKKKKMAHRASRLIRSSCWLLVHVGFSFLTGFVFLLKRDLSHPDGGAVGKVNNLTLSLINSVIQLGWHDIIHVTSFIRKVCGKSVEILRWLRERDCHYRLLHLNRSTNHYFRCDWNDAGEGWRSKYSSITTLFPNSKFENKFISNETIVDIYW